MGQRAKEKELKGVIPGILRILDKFSPYIRQQKLLIAGSFLALLLETGLRLLEPWPLKYVFDYILIPAHNNNTNLTHTYGLSPVVLLTLSAVGIVVISGVGSIAAYISTYGMSLAVVRVLSTVRANVFHHLQHLSLSFHQKSKSGDLITRVTADIEKMRTVTVKTALPLFTNTFSLVGMLGIMFWLNWELALVVTAIFPLLFLLTSQMISRIRKFAKKHRDSEGVLAATTGETMGAIKVVQVLSLQEMLHSVFSTQNQKSLDEAIESLRLSAALERAVQILMAIIIAVVLWRGSHVVLHKELTPGELLVFMTYLRNAFEPMRKLSNQIGQIAKATASGERVVEILDYEPNVQDLPGAKPAHPFFGAVRFENVFFGYDTGKDILKNISLTVQPGQQIALVGASGGGKSTLLSLILRLYDPEAGRILIDGQDIREYTLNSLRQQISVVLQESVLFAVSVRENIAYGKLGATDKEVEKAARLANAHEFIMNLPQGYDTILGDRGGTLSGGQRQRIAIARAAIRQAPIVILDEPTTGLDKKSEYIVNSALAKLTEGRTTFIISHNLKAVENADIILYVEGGSILEQGTHPELMRLGGYYATLYQIQGIVEPEGDIYAVEA
ncbi:ABC transporter ATP-binding protein [Nostoc parmelioides]|uniref:ABC transporter ATP-binding protein n=1 Tax=Nostoc parmelioides FACHB-3921 TaxID=2692909 RepID=A0ABR8B8T1_9NOSO|nr:ABC transporter ATP-binding protein [Nostoc parmelioides]MBD2250099.1 ABC transporter ATP-binding protein [Nostoc parmelioides FACHB-3921]